MFKFNESYKEYYKIVEEAQALGRSKSKDYFEEHHIIPRSLGGSNNKSNLVLLTPEEHYLCHSLLLKFCDGEAYYLMLYAWNMLNNFSNFSGVLLLGAEEYGKYKKEFALSITGSNHHNSKIIYQLDEITGRIKEVFGSVAEASTKTGFHRSNISVCAVSKKFKSIKNTCWAYQETLIITMENILIKQPHHLSKKVYQLDEITGNIIKLWNSVSEATLELGAKSISNLVLFPSYGTSKNFCWSYPHNLKKTQLLIIDHSSKDKIKPVYQLNKKTGEIIHFWDSVKIASKNARSKNISPGDIYSRAKRTDAYTAGGFCWAYEENLEETIKNIKKKLS